MTVEDLAKSHYEDARLARVLGARSELHPAEEKVLEIYRDRILDQRVLDLGCGGGRTTARLSAMAHDYVGLDYSATLIETCKQRHPEVTFVHGDATDLSMFDDGAFDVVVFSYNGIDTMSHGNRLKVLGEVYRVLRPGGLFVFSSHSIEYEDRVAWFDKRSPLSPFKLYRNAINLLSYLQVRRHQVRTSSYALLSDPKAGYKQLTYYIAKADQVEQLEQVGFRDTAIFDWKGRLVTAATEDRESMAFYYVCSKPATNA